MKTLAEVTRDGQWCVLCHQCRSTHETPEGAQVYLGNDAKDPVYEKCPGFVEPVTREEFDRLVAHVDTFTDAFGHVKAALDGLTRGGLRTSARSALNRLRRIADAVIFEARR